MKEENKKRINKLMIPFTKRTLSFLTATTMLVTGTVSCKEETKNTSSDTNSSVSSSLEENDVLEGNNVAINQEENNTVDNEENSNSNNQVSNEENNNTTVTQPDNNVNNSNNNINSNSNNNTNKNNTSNNSSINNNSNQNSTSNTSKPITSTPSVEPSMPSALTASNINDVEVFEYFSKNIYTNYSANITYIGYWYNNKVYYGDIEESRFFLLLLNSDYINTNTYNNFFESKSIDDLNKMSNFVAGILNYAGQDDLNIHFDKIVIDNNKREFLKLLHSAIKEKTLRQFVINYFNGNQKYFNYQDDYVMDYFVNCAGYNLLDLNDNEVSCYVVDKYYDITEKMEIHIKDNLYLKYKGAQYQKQ